jgi:DNA integrity scanning protein DisA with diadenylate cyclase activity
VSDAIAVVVSASSGTVTVYEGGETVLELERAQASS